MWHCDEKEEAMTTIGISFNCNRPHLLTNCRDTESHICDSHRVTTRPVPMFLATEIDI
jgi:hypothetical protein